MCFTQHIVQYVITLQVLTISSWRNILVFQELNTFLVLFNRISQVFHQQAIVSAMIFYYLYLNRTIIQPL